MSDDETSWHKGRLHFSRRTYTAIGLVAIVSVSIFVYAYYSLGASSVSGLTVRLVFANRTYMSGTFPNRNITYFMEVQVWSTTQSFDIQITSPRLAVCYVNPICLLNATLDTGTVRPNSRLTYNLRSNINESLSPGTLYYSAISLDLTMNAQSSSGFYSQQITRHDTVFWNWTTATGLRYPT